MGCLLAGAGDPAARSEPGLLRLCGSTRSASLAPAGPRPLLSGFSRTGSGSGPRRSPSGRRLTRLASWYLYKLHLAFNIFTRSPPSNCYRQPSALDRVSVVELQGGYPTVSGKQSGEPRGKSSLVRERSRVPGKFATFLFVQLFWSPEFDSDDVAHLQNTRLRDPSLFISLFLKLNSAHSGHAGG